MVRSSPLLAKLARPKLKQPVRRLRLFERLDCARSDSRSVFVAGPPGAGKTTLVASWLDARGVEGLWYRADPADRDPATFFHYLRDAVLGGSRRRVRTLPHLTPEYRSDVAGFARRFFRDMFRQLPEGSVFVLDNFQDAGGVAVMERVFAELLYEACGGSIVVVVSREEPPASFARARAEETLLRVDPAELRLTVDEAREVARGRFVGTDEALAALVRQADGWAAGLTLLLESAGRPGWAVGSYPAITRGEVFGYLATQVFEHMTEEERSFLLATARLPPFSVAMAEALTGNARSGEILSSLYRRHLFVHCTGDSERYFQYHGLFRGYLQHQGDAAMTAQQVQAMQRDAAAVCLNHGHAEQAIDLFIEAKAWPAAVPALEEVMHECLRQGRHDQIAAWIGRLPEAISAGSPAIQYAHGIVAAIDDAPRALGLIAAAHRRFVDADDIVGGARCACAMIEIIFHQTSDHRAMLPWIDALASMFERGFRCSDTDLLLRCHASLLLARLFARPDHRLEDAAAAALELLPVSSSGQQRLLATTYLTIYATFAGRFDLTPVLELHGDSLVGQAAVTAHGRANWYLWKAYMLRLAGRYADAVDSAGKADAIAATEGFGQIAFLAAYFASGAEASRGRLEAAAALEARAEASVDSSKPLQVALLSACSAWLALYRQDGWQARRCGERAMSVARTLSAPSYRIHYGIPFVYGLAETGALNEAREVLEEQRRAIAGTALTCFAPLLLAVEARIEELDGNVDRSIVLVRAMWRCAVSTGHGDYLHWVKPWVVRFADLALREDVETTYVVRLIHRHGWQAGPGCSECWPWPVKIHALGRFTLRVGGEVPRHGRKAPRRPLELLRLLIALGEEGVPEAAVLDCLWPEEEADLAHKAFAAALHRLRSLLGRTDAVELSGGRLTLNPGIVWTDVREFLQLADGCLENHESEDCLEAAARARHLYRGAFLPDETDAGWVLKHREALRERFVRLVERTARMLEDRSRHEEAGQWYEHGIAVDELVERFHQGLMRCLSFQGQVSEVGRVYRRLQRTLARAFGRTPSPESEGLYLASLITRSLPPPEV